MAKGYMYFWKQMQISTCRPVTISILRKSQQQGQEEESGPEDAKDYSSPRVASAKKSSDVRKITFDMEPEIYKIHIKDYPEGMPKRIYRDPNKPYVFRKIEDLTDDQSKSDSTLGQTRARAKAIIMEKDGLHRYVDEVRIIIGPKFDMLIKLDGDKEDLIFLEELVEHEAERSSRSPRISCAFHYQYKPKIEDSFSTLVADMTLFLHEKLKE